MNDINALLKGNCQWAQQQARTDPDFFTRLNKGQTPEYLWIGCCDSRVPAEVVTGLQPGDMLVHRNIANQVLPVDINTGAILQFALDVLKIRKVVITGHYNCGGVKSAIAGGNCGNVANWLCALQDLYHRKQDHFAALDDNDAKADLLSELNVAKQVINVARSDTARNIWKAGEKLAIHGLIYDLKTGLLKDLNLCIHDPAQLENLQDA